MDDVTLEPLKNALADPAPHKLIVVHMIGAHPHFSLRYPEGLQPTWSDDDEVSRQMKANDRSIVVGLQPTWSDDDEVSRQMKANDRSIVVQHAREQYDLAVLYQDTVLADSLELTEASSKHIPAFWLYLSDHGVETGNYENRTGHSQTTPNGYRIPFLMWADPTLSTQWVWSDLQHRSFRSDGLNYENRTGHSQTTPNGYRIPFLMWADPTLSTQWVWSDLQHRSFRSDGLRHILFTAAGIELKSQAMPSLLSKDYQWQDPPSKTRFLSKP